MTARFDLIEYSRALIDARKHVVTGPRGRIRRTDTGIPSVLRYRRNTSRGCKQQAARGHQQRTHTELRRRPEYHRRLWLPITMVTARAFQVARVFLLLLGVTTALATPDIEYVKGTVGGKQYRVRDDRWPALYTADYGDCSGESLINVTRFDAAYYRDNMTVLFHLEGETAISENIMMSIGVFAYGESRFELTFNPCSANINRRAWSIALRCCKMLIQAVPVLSSEEFRSMLKASFRSTKEMSRASQR